MQNSSDIISVLDVKGVITYVSPSVSTVLDHTVESIEGTDWYALVNPEDAPGLRMRLLNVVA